MANGYTKVRLMSVIVLGFLLGVPLSAEPFTYTFTTIADRATVVEFGGVGGLTTFGFGG